MTIKGFVEITSRVNSCCWHGRRPSLIDTICGRRQRRKETNFTNGWEVPKIPGVFKHPT